MKTISEIKKILSEKSGIPLFFETEFSDLEKARNATGNPSSLRVFDESGTEYPYMDKEMRFDNPHRNIKAVKFLNKNYRNIEDFGFEIKFIKKTRICEGGGWTSQGGIYEVEGMQFEC